MTWFVPGRIEVFGKHTDYAGGRSLLVASSQGVTASAVDPAEGTTVEPGDVIARSTAMDGDLFLTAGKTTGLPAGNWGHYVQATIDRLSSNFGTLKPAVIEVDSTLPLASGMSSSSALVCAVALALADHNNLWDDPRWIANIKDRVDLAAYLATIENGLDFKDLPGAKGVGTFGGSQDHTAMLNCEEGQIGAFRFAPTVPEDSNPIPGGYTFVVAVSGALAEKTGAALEDYNNASLRVSRLVGLWNQHAGTSHTTLAQVLEQEGARDELLQMTAEDQDLGPRLRAYLTEMETAIPAAIAALEAGDVQAFGEATEVSHRNADENLKNQIAETNTLQSLARELGAPAASGFGAGFGGSVWALIPTDAAEAFAEKWLANYLQEFPQHADRAAVLITPPSPAARRLTD